MRYLALDEIENTRLDWRHKGLPVEAHNTRLADLGKLKLNVLREEMRLPAAILKESNIAHNSAWMKKFLKRASAKICPHGKTTMAPQLFERQLADGAWGLTAGTVGHIQVYRRHNVKRILFANQLIRKGDINYILDEIEQNEEFDFYCLVDSTAVLDRLVAEVLKRKMVRPLQVLLEVGATGGRTGVRSVEQGTALAGQIATCAPKIVLRGIELFEGVFAGDMIALEGRVAAMLGNLSEIAMACEQANYFSAEPILLTAGGSAFFDIAAQRLAAAKLNSQVEVVLRSGCYLTHDSHHYEAFAHAMSFRAPEIQDFGQPLRPALEICAYVQSVPESRRAIANFGKRDASYDIDLPTPLWWFRPGHHVNPKPLAGHRVSGLNDQHAYVDSQQETHLQVGDMVGFGISHPCTTFDKWPVLYMVDDDYTVTSAIMTFF